MTKKVMNKAIAFNTMFGGVWFKPRASRNIEKTITNLVKLVTMTNNPGATLSTVMIANSWISRPERLAPSSVPGVTSPKAEERSRTILPRSASCAEPADPNTIRAATSMAVPVVKDSETEDRMRAIIRYLRRSL